jgi:3-isopropylmalate dehydrogenase
LLLLPGDGIGPEVIGEVKRVIATLRLDLDVSEALFGGASIDAHGVPVTERRTPC